MQIQPVQSNLLIRMCQLPVEGDDKKVIILPDQTDPLNVAKYPYGEVLAVGPDCKFCHVNDKVLFLASNAIGFEHPQEIQYIIPEACVLAKYAPEELKSDKTLS